MGGETKWLARTWAVALLLGCLIAAAPATARGTAGLLDQSFGDGGRMATAADLGSSWRDVPISLATSPDGSTVVASRRQLFRYGRDGRLDSSFGVEGKVTIEQIEGLSFHFVDIAVDDAGRLVAFGTVEDLSTEPRIPTISWGGWVHPAFAAVLRFDTSGHLDSSFGNGDGIVRTDLGLPHELEAEDHSFPPLVRVVAGVVDSEGRPSLLIATYERLLGQVHDHLDWVNRVVARLTPSGDLDPSFGTGRGIVVLADGRSREISTDLAGEALFLSGSRPETSWVTRLRADGSAAGDFGTGGLRTVDGGGGDIAIDRLGRLLIIDRPAANSAQVLRLGSSGDLDPSYGRGGRVSVKVPEAYGAVSSLAVDERGRALLVGTSSRALSSQHKGGDPAVYVLVGRLRASGARDRRFGHQGWLRTGFGRRTKVASAHETTFDEDVVGGPEAVLDSRGRLVVADAAHSPQLEPGGVVLARYRLGR